MNFGTQENSEIFLIWHLLNKKKIWTREKFLGWYSEWQTFKMCQQKREWTRIGFGCYCSNVCLCTVSVICGTRKPYIRTRKYLRIRIIIFPARFAFYIVILTGLIHFSMPHSRNAVEKVGINGQCSYINKYRYIVHIYSMYCFEMGVKWWWAPVIHIPFARTDQTMCGQTKLNYNIVYWIILSTILHQRGVKGKMPTHICIVCSETSA